MAAGSAIDQYKKVGVFSDAAYADPHRLISMLLEGAITQINVAKGAMREEKVALKGETISKAISILDGLRASLDFDKGGEIATNLEGLYDYMQRRLFEGNLHNDAAKLSEVIELLTGIKEAWEAIPDPVRQEHKKVADESAT